MLRIPIARLFHLVWSRVDNDDEAACRLARDPDADVSRLSVEYPTCVRVNGVVKVFVAFKLLPFSLSYLLTARNISVFLMVLARCSSCNRLHSLFD